MNPGFNPPNLNASEKLVVNPAAGKGKQRLAETEPGRGYVDLTDSEQVKDYLMRTAEAAYNLAVRGVVAQFVMLCTTPLVWFSKKTRMKFTCRPFAGHPGAQLIWPISGRFCSVG